MSHPCLDHEVLSDPEGHPPNIGALGDDGDMWWDPGSYPDDYDWDRA